MLVGDGIGCRRARSSTSPPAARSPTSDCVIAFSTFDQPVPANSLFGRTTVTGEHVLCVNPVALQGADASVDPILPSAPFAPGTLIAAGFELLGSPSRGRRRSGRACPAPTRPVLRRRRRRRAPAHGRWPEPRCPTPSPDPTWGLHLLDANVELGNLVSVVNAQASNWLDLKYGHCDERRRRTAAPILTAPRLRGTFAYHERTG